MTVDQREMTYGEKAVGLTFNPSGDPVVNDMKRDYAKIIDELNNLRDASSNEEQRRLFSVAITEAQSAQMWAVKARTWKLE
jgi:superfamily I DNA/RNA helicase